MPADQAIFQQLGSWKEKLQRYEPFYWANPHYQEPSGSRFSFEDVLDAEARLNRFKPFLSAAFPDSGLQDGLIESPLVEIPSMREVLARRLRIRLPAEDQLLLKCDHALPISGSIKARGGIYEVLKYAEKLALEDGWLSLDQDYSRLAEAKARQFFSQFRLVAGSTGNLGLSIGIIGRALGFGVDIHMSADARAWKKDKLRSIGVTVHEHTGDFSAAVTLGRRQALSQLNTHFIDDENSADLFFGYSVAAVRLKSQLEQLGRVVDETHPLIVYLPCGVGGGPGGITFGLKQIFGNAVHCVIAEPAHAPAMMVGLMIGGQIPIAVQDIGLDGVTAADGLAVGCASAFVRNEIASLVSGCYTVTDEELFRYLALLSQSESIQIEPSACAGFGGLKYRQEILPEQFESAVHLVWSTGGNMVPEGEMSAYLSRGNFLLEKFVS